jgi:hypothetical protein
MGDRPNYGSGEFRVICAAAPKSERQIVSLGRRLSSAELRVNITCELCRFQHTQIEGRLSSSEICVIAGVDWYEVCKFRELIHDYPN